MRDVPEWGRVKQTKQEGLPERADDYCGGILEWSRHPAWTERMRAALKTRQESGGKWFSLIDRMYDLRQLQLAWVRIDLFTTGAARRRGAGVDGVTVEKFVEQAGEEIPRLGEELKTVSSEAGTPPLDIETGDKQETPLGPALCKRQGGPGGPSVVDRTNLRM